VTHHLDRRRRISVLFDVFTVGNRVRALLVHAMAGSGLRPDEYAAYSAVLEVGPLTISELAQVMGMPLTTASDYVRTMTARGHALRSRNPADSRSYLVSLTEDGVAAHHRAMVAFVDAIERVRAALPIAERDLARALHALDDAVRQVLEDRAVEERTQQRAAGQP
jgi:DNA-binding MarR family transcriptional regulator